MNPYDKVHELVRAMKESEEVKEYLIIKEEVYKDEKNKELIKEFREKQMEVQSLLMQGKEAEAEKMEKLQNLYQILASNVKITVSTEQYSYVKITINVNNIKQSIV